MPTLSRIAPELPVSDLRGSLEYYEKKLGFEIAMQMPAGDYAIVERDGVAIHRSRWAYTSSRPTWTIFTPRCGGVGRGSRRKLCASPGGIAIFASTTNPAMKSSSPNRSHSAQIHAGF